LVLSSKQQSWLDEKRKFLFLAIAAMRSTNSGFSPLLTGDEKGYVWGIEKARPLLTGLMFV